MNYQDAVDGSEIILGLLFVIMIILGLLGMISEYKLRRINKELDSSYHEMDRLIHKRCHDRCSNGEQSKTCPCRCHYYPEMGCGYHYAVVELWTYKNKNN